MTKISRRNWLALVSGGLWAWPESAGWSITVPAVKAPLDDIARGFLSPPKSARPWVYWMWLNGNITRAGITADLEAMQRVGIGGALILELGSWKAGPVRFMSPEYQAMIQHAIAEAARLGLEIDLNNDDGWDNGGPWITPDVAMQKLTWTETAVRGPVPFRALLAKPSTRLNYYRDVAVVAFRTPPDDCPDARLPDPQIARLQGRPVALELTFIRPIVAQSLVITGEPRAAGKPPAAKLQVETAGGDFRTACEFETGWQHLAAWYPSLTASFPKTEGRRFRVTFPRGIGKGIAIEARLSAAARLSAWELKTGHSDIREHGGGAEVYAAGQEPEPILNAGEAIARSDVIDLTVAMDKDGRLTWDAPAGDWTILRVGYTPTGATNNAATAAGRGLDCDKLRRAGVEAVFAGMLDKLASQNAGASGLRWFHSDSWEGGPQNWTEGLERTFREHCDYNLLPFLPVLAGGHVVESVEASNRFLWDFRRLLADLIRTEFYESMRQLSHARGVKLTCEGTGRPQFLNDPLAYQRQADLPMGEFWMGEVQPRPDCKASAAAGHTGAQSVIGAEAFTCVASARHPDLGRWLEHPYTLKVHGDEAFCWGINHFVFHRYIHQPWLNRRPGLTWAGMQEDFTPRSFGIGINFERTQTWWEQGAAWLDYLARCQYLLRQGLFVGDICIFTGEGVPNALIRWNRRLAGEEGPDVSTVTQLGFTRCHLLPPEPPPGYDYDGCDPAVLMQMSMRNGRLTLPNGMSYAVLVFPPLTAMTPQLLGKLKELLEAGATVVAPKPAASPSLRGYPECDHTVRRLADELWGAAGSDETLRRSIGRGTLLWGVPLATVMREAALPPDFQYASTQPQANIDYIHRRWDDADAYFVSNQLQREEALTCAFRVNGKVPELWHPETGEIRPLAIFSQERGVTTVPLRLHAAESVFMIFRQATDRGSVVDVTRAGQPVDRALEIFRAAGRAGTARPVDGENQAQHAAKGDGWEGVVWETGRYIIRNSKGQERMLERTVPPPIVVTGPWNVNFPPRLGAPLQIRLQKLISWTEHPDVGVRHFSGTAEYTTWFDVPGTLLRDGLRLDLDLGEVREIAEVAVNGKTCRTLWKPPFRTEITPWLKPASNRLTIRVTNLWPNRLAADSSLPVDQRVTWSNWNPYTADFKLLPSGLLGPVTLRVGVRFET